MRENGLTLLCVLFLILVVVILILDYMRLYKEYHLPESFTGKTVYKLHRSAMYWLGMGITITVFFGAAIYVCIDYNASTDEFIFYTILLLLAILEMCVLDLKPEKVYENGILHRREGFVAWYEIEKVKILNSTQNEILLERKNFECDDLKLNCIPGMAGGIVDYIEKQLSQYPTMNYDVFEKQNGILSVYKQCRTYLLNHGILPWIRYFMLLGTNLVTGYLLYHSFF